MIEIADRVYCDAGWALCCGWEYRQNYSLRDLVQMIVGEAMGDSQREPLPEAGKPVLQLNEVMVGEIGPVTFSLQPGEMLALAGLRGRARRSWAACYLAYAIVIRVKLFSATAPIPPLRRSKL